MKTFGREQFDYPPYSPDLAPSYFNVFLHLKTFLGGRRFHEDNEVKEAVNKWFSSQAVSFYDRGIQKLVPRYDKCLNNGGNYVEK
jgi:histone-lysine N-methyltransferase SETMAR